MSALPPKAAFASPCDVAAELRRLAGELYPRTAAQDWAAVVAVLEEAAIIIETRGPRDA
ncbi:MAG TPA: hypothetical protein VGF07_05975 [Stellaceae bacterium]